MIVPCLNDVPILLPGHDDKEVGIDIFHFHIDPRFDSGDRKGAIIGRIEDIQYLDKESKKPYEFTITNPTQDCIWLTFLWQKIVTGTNKPLTICPHKGIKLLDCKRCPGHGLPNPIPKIEDLVANARNVNNEILGSVKVVDCVFPEITIDIIKEGYLKSIEVNGIDIFTKAVPYLVQLGDFIKLTLGPITI